ncbi:PREDICTED: uncharacterized protein LOC104744730 [Camelina sativa]|uniref:Uncharacterized protein LOC104744730 n=1 Tax=Camelina sativa TaxID=90675 RepID=A0ABM1QZG5_CAMSA|nr:PREDICTED: uncharacterized protein LOC104744730 [Camelina sativa]
MERSREEESQAGDGGNNNHHSRIADEGPRLNLPLTKTPELINLIQNYLNRNNPCSPQQSESSKTSMLPPKVPAERLKAMNFPISMIIIGQWEYRATNPDDIVAKLYFAKKKLIWEILDGPRLNLPLTKTPELINLIQNYLNRNNPCSPQQSESSKTSMLPPKVPAERLKAMNFPISMIIIGQWEYRATNPDDIVAKLYFAKKKLIWEILDAGDPKTKTPRLKSKIEIQWDDVASFEESINSRDKTGILKIELKKRPKFFKETNPQAGKHTQWKQMDQDFTVDQAASWIHTLHFDAGVLQKNLEKLLSDSFWGRLYDVHFPVREAVLFDIDYGSNNNTNSSSYVLSQTRHFNVNSDLIHHPSQGIGRVGVGEGNSNMAPRYWANNGSQNSYGQANSWVYTGNELFKTQAIPPPVSSQFSNGHYNRQSHYNGSRQSNPMTQYESEAVQNTRGVLGSQAYALPPTQTNLMMPQHMNVIPTYPPVGPYLGSTLRQEEERQRREHTHTHLDGNFQLKDYQKFLYMSNNWPMLPDMDKKDDSNDNNS